MKKSRRLFLPIDDYDNELIIDQMTQKFVQGTGFCGWNESAIIDPSEIVGSSSGRVSSAVTEEHEAVLMRSLSNKSQES